MSELLPYMKCFKPIKIWLTSSQEQFVPCGKCFACLNQKRSALGLKLHLEETHSKFCYFITLTYSDENLPLFKLEDSYISDNYFVPTAVSQRIVSDFDESRFDASEPWLVSKSDEIFKSLTSYSKQVSLYETEHSYFAPYGHGNFALLYYRDIQLFLKRFRKYVQKKYSEKIRYYVIGEYGSRSLRPHWHLLLFFNSADLSRDFELSENVGSVSRPCNSSLLLCKFWKFGLNDTKRTDGKAFYYVSSYVAKPTDFPTILNVLSPQKAYHSRFLGEVLEEEEIKSCLQNEDFERLRKHCISNSDGTLSDYALWRSYYSRFFPKYSGLSFQTIEQTYSVFTSYKRLVDFFHTDSVSDIAYFLFESFSSGKKLSPTLLYFRNLFDIQYALCLRSDKSILSALCSAIRSSKKFLFYAETFGFTSSAYFKLWQKWYSFVDLNTLNEHFRNCELDSEYSRLYYSTMEFLPDGSSRPSPYFAHPDLLLLGIKRHETEKYLSSVKHRDVIARINNLIGI